MPRDFRTPSPVMCGRRCVRHAERRRRRIQLRSNRPPRRPASPGQPANDQLRALSAALRDDPAFPREVKDFEERIIPLQAGITSYAREELLLTWAAVLMVLLIGCVNIAGLLLARSGARAREIATRMALGGNRRTIVRQLLMESVMLALRRRNRGRRVGRFRAGLAEETRRGQERTLASHRAQRAGAW